MATEKNLKEAFAGESQANRMYLAFAQQAASEGFPQVAKLFRAAAAAETVHAHAHFRVMGGVKDTAANLEAAAISFRNALAVEEIHHDLYSEALESLKKGKDLARQDIFVCEICGNTVYGHAPDQFPVCSAEKMFQEVA